MTQSRDQRDQASVSETALLQEIRAELRALEDIEPGEEVWVRIQDRTRGQSAGRYDHRYTQPLAMAAGLLIAVVVGLLTLDAFKPTTSTSTVAGAAVDPALQALLRRSRELEPLVQNARYARSDSAERAFIYRIADVDSQLTGTKPDGRLPTQREVKKLWGQRVALLESLAEVRRARAVLRPAVY